MQSSVSTKWSLLRKFRILLSLLIYCVFSLQIVNVVNVSSGGSVKREMRIEHHSSSRNESLDLITDCLTCASLNKEIAIHLKVEAIKQQILSKLQLKDRPKLTSAIPRELVDEALKKAHLDVDSVSHRPRVASIRQHQPQQQPPQHSSTISPSTPISSSFAPVADHTQSDAANIEFGDESDEFDMDNDFDDYSPRPSPSEEYYGKTSEIIAFSEPGGTVNGHTLVEFLPHIDKVHELEVTKAILWVQLRHRKTLTRKVRHMLREHTLTLYVFRVNSIANDSVPLDLQMLAKKKMQTVRPGWKHIDFRVPVQEWFSGPRSKLTLLIDCVGCDTLVDILLFNDEQHRNENGNKHGEQTAAKSSHGHKSGYRPFLVIGTKPIASHRSKRHVITCDTRVKQCCKQSLYISFKELGWSDWIIAPKGYYANYCMGDCSKRGRTPDTFAHFHSHVIDEYRNKNPYASITPCCAPTRLSAMSLIYFDRDLNIIKADLPKMIVEECGCT